MSRRRLVVGAFTTRSIRAKLLLAFGGLLLLSGMNTVATVWGTRQREQRFSELRASIERQATLAEIQRAVEDQNTHVRVLSEIMGLDSTGDEADVAAVAASLDSISGLLGSLGPRDSGTSTELLEKQVVLLFESWKRFYRYQLEDPSKAISELLLTSEPLAAKLLSETLPEAIIDEKAALDRASESFARMDRRYSSLVQLLFVVSTLLGSALAISVSRALLRSIEVLKHGAERVGSGDLGYRVETDANDELGEVAQSFNSMVDRLRTIVTETVETARLIRVSANDLSSRSAAVAAASERVSDAMMEITAGAETQAIGLRSADTALHHMRGHADSISLTSDQVRTLSGQIRGLAMNRRDDIARSLDALLDIRTVVEQSASEVNQLDRASDTIAGFVQTIRGIAEQTNLLALNAAIEAARAGEHGRGFAIVADEVRKLAENSAVAASEVANTVHQIRAQIEAVVATMNTGTAKVAGVEHASKDAEDAFEEIIGAVEKVQQAAGAAAGSAIQNQDTVGSVQAAMQSVGATAQAHAAEARGVGVVVHEQAIAAQEMAGATQQLLIAAEQLEALVSEFRTDGTTSSDAEPQRISIPIEVMPRRMAIP